MYNTVVYMLLTHTHTFNGPFSGTTQVSWYQKGKTNTVFLKQETVSGSGISWAICKSASRSRQITMPVPYHSSLTDRMPFLPPNQQRQSTEGKIHIVHIVVYILLFHHNHKTTSVSSLTSSRVQSGQVSFSTHQKGKPFRILMKQEPR